MFDVGFDSLFFPFPSVWFSSSISICLMHAFFGNFFSLQTEIGILIIEGNVHESFTINWIRKRKENACQTFFSLSPDHENNECASHRIGKLAEEDVSELDKMESKRGVAGERDRESIRFDMQKYVQTKYGKAWIWIFVAPPLLSSIFAFLCVFDFCPSNNFSSTIWFGYHNCKRCDCALKIWCVSFITLCLDISFNTFMDVRLLHFDKCELCHFFLFFIFTKRNERRSSASERGTLSSKNIVSSSLLLCHFAHSNSPDTSFYISFREMKDARCSLRVCRL